MRPSGRSFASDAEGAAGPASPPRHSRGLPHYCPIFPWAPGTRRAASGGCRLSRDGEPPPVLHLVRSGRIKAQGVASSGRDEQRDACWEACAKSLAGR